MLKPVVLTWTAHAMTAPTAMRSRLTPRPMASSLGSSRESSDQRQKRCHDQHEEEELRDRESPDDSEQDEQDDHSEQQRHNFLLPFVTRGSGPRESSCFRFVVDTLSSPSG